MTDPIPEGGSFLPLSPDFLRQHFPVAPSLRRENRDLFGDFLSAGQLRDDDAFYAALARMVTCDAGIEALRTYDRRMKAKGDERKAFALRALRWLHQQNVELDLPSVLQRRPDDLPPLSEERTILTLFQRLSSAAETPVVEQDMPTDRAEDRPGAEVADEIPPETDWRALAQDLARAAAKLDHPDAAAAERILALAGALATACRTAAEAAAADAALAGRAEALRARLAAAYPDLAGTWPEGVDAAFLDALEAGLDALDSAEGEATEAEGRHRVLEDEARAAQAAGDLDAEEDLLPRRRAARTALTAAQAAVQAAWLGLANLLQGPKEPPAAPEAAETPEAPASSEHSSAPAVVSEPADAQAVDADDVDEVTAEGAADPLPEIDATEDDAPHPSAISPAGSDAGLEVPAAPPATESVPQDVAPPAADLTDRTLAYWLHAGEIALAYHTARLSERQGKRPAIPPAVLRGLALLRDIRRAEDMADPQRNAAMAEMMEALAAAEPRAAAVAFAALLRPALFDPDHGARAHLRNLPRDGALAPYAGVMDAIGALGHEVRLSVRTLAELGGQQVAPATPQACEALRAWWSDAQKRKCMHQPTYRILHEELRPNGQIGAILQGVLDDAPGAADKARDFVDRLGADRAAQEAFVEEAERRSGRPRRDRIEGMALTWFCERLEEACDRLADWLESRAQDSAAPGDSQRQRLLAALGPLRKAMQQRPSPDLSPSPGEPDLDAAIATLAMREMNALDQLLSGKVAPGPLPTAEEVLEGPLLRLPGGCQDWTGGDPKLVAEREARDRRLAAALDDPASLAPDLAEALARRCSDGAFLAASGVLRQMETAAPGEDEAEARRQRIGEALDEERRSALERVERLHQSFATLANLDLDQAESNRGRLARLAAIAAALRADPEGEDVALPAANGLRNPEVPPDFPELRACLSDLEDRRDSMRAAVVERQRQALAALCDGPTAEGARALLERLDQLDPVTVDDAIADLRAGRPVHLPDDDAPDMFEIFFPAFVRAVSHEGAAIGRGQIQMSLTAGRDLGPLRLSTLDSQTRKRSQQLLETWGSAENALRQSQPDRLAGAMERLFGLIGLAGVSVRPGREAVPGRVRALTMQFEVPHVTDWFLPPAFGSGTGGRFRLLAARDDVPVDQILREIGAEAPDGAWIVAQFRRLGEDDRRTLARRCRDDARRMLMLDETLLLFLASRADDPLRAFFACALPFAWVQPYVIDPGPIPREVFFGREDEIRRIVAREAGGCLIYGGRQLGKSALLHHIRRERHRPERGEVALYLDIKPLGGLGSPAERIWDELAHALPREAGISPAGNGRQPVLDAIRSWLDSGADRRMLVMLDEADNFLRAEHGAGYPNLLPLKALMEATGRRFKTVFAGLHNVRRMARAPNSPLPHLGEPICIGPMNQTEANRAALRRLARDPMRAAGLDFADPALAWDMLARMNHYPSLVQIFGHQVVDRLGRRPDRRSGPRWKLSREVLFEGSAAEAISAQIRDRFQLTLNLDVRYELFAKAIALYRLDSSGGHERVLSDGLTAEEIRNKALDFLPQGLARPSLADCEEILSEMVDLGVLAQLGPNRFGLRNAQVAQMLGDRDRLETELLQLAEREDDPAYDAGSFHASLRPDRPKDRAPLSDRQLQQLFGAAGAPVTLIVAPEWIAGAEIGPRLVAAAGPFGARPALITAEDAALRRALEAGGLFVVTGGWSADRAQRVVDRLGSRGAKSRILWLVQENPPELPDLPRVYVRPWDDAMLRLWLVDEGLAPALDDRETRAAIMEATGGLPARLMALRPELADLVSRPVGERQARLADWARAQPSIADAAGLTEQERAVLRFMSENGAALELVEELTEFCPEAEPARLDRLIAGGWLHAADRPGSVPTLSQTGRLAAA